jgi:hypothetical protein
MELFTANKIAIQIMDHDPKDCGSTRSDFETYSAKKVDAPIQKSVLFLHSIIAPKMANKDIQK